MTRAKKYIAVTASCLLVSTGAMAAELTGPEITTLISGNTVYMEFQAGNVNTGAGQGLLVYSADGKVVSKFPNGNAWKGTYVIKDNTSCITWEGRPPNPCTKYNKDGDKITLINVESGQPRGVVTKTAPGNPEKL